MPRQKSCVRIYVSYCGIKLLMIEKKPIHPIYVLPFISGATSEEHVPDSQTRPLLTFPISSLFKTVLQCNAIVRLRCEGSFSFNFDFPAARLR